MHIHVHAYMYTLVSISKLTLMNIHNISEQIYMFVGLRIANKFKNYT